MSLEPNCELTDNTKVNAFGVTLYQIRATRDIPARGVRKGDLGGWIESAELSYGVARVSGNAWVYGNAEVYGNARVYGNAEVSGSARVSGPSDYFVMGPIGSENVYATLVRTKTGHLLTVGCWTNGSLDTLMKEVKRRRKAYWSANEATQALWMEQYRALKRIGKNIAASWAEPDE